MNIVLPTHGETAWDAPLNAVLTELNNGKVDVTLLGVASGVATLDPTGVVPTNQLPPAGPPPYQVFSQMVPATTWTINHSFPVRPLVTLYDTYGNEMMADVTYPSPTQISVSFAYPTAGSVTLR